jgi:hypothetical protein
LAGLLQLFVVQQTPFEPHKLERKVSISAAADVVAVAPDERTIAVAGTV